MFLIGTKDIEWLGNWRDTKAIGPDNRLTCLETMMSTIRTVGGNRPQNQPRMLAAAEPVDSVDLEAMCLRCRHKHKNRNCFRQHPELRNDEAYMEPV